MKKLAVGLLTLLILLSGAAVHAAGGGESLVTRSYLEDTYVPALLEQAGDRVEAGTQEAYQSALDRLDSLRGGGAAGSSALTDSRFKEGDVIRLSSGSGAMLLAGSAVLSYGSGGGAADVTAGEALPSGAALAAAHRVLAAEGAAAVTVTSPTAVLSLEGSYTVSSGSGTDYNALAGALGAMGLFQGTGTAYGSGYDLEQAPTRVVGLVMFLRLIGEEGAALSSTAANPFSDTPAWCDRYVAYAWERGYTQGVGTDAAGRRYFGPNDPLSAGEYVTFLLRALGYTDGGSAPDFAWDTALERAEALGLLTSGERAMLEGERFLRAQVVYLSYFALSAPLKGGDGVLLDRTAASGGLSLRQLRDVMDGVTVERLD